MMVNCFCGMVDWLKAVSLISSRDHCILKSLIYSPYCSFFFKKKKREETKKKKRKKESKKSIEETRFNTLVPILHQEKQINGIGSGTYSFRKMFIQLQPQVWWKSEIYNNLETRFFSFIFFFFTVNLPLKKWFPYQKVILMVVKLY